MPRALAERAKFVALGPSLSKAQQVLKGLGITFPQALFGLRMSSSRILVCIIRRHTQAMYHTARDNRRNPGTDWQAPKGMAKHLNVTGFWSSGR